MSWIADLRTFIDRIRVPGRQRSTRYPEDIVTDLYRGLLKREPDDAGLQSHAGPLRAGIALEHVVRGFVSSPEFRTRMIAALVPHADLPDLTQVMPEHYETQIARGMAITTYTGRCDLDIDVWNH